ncbi:hypothetical protein SPBR_05177 [Sporothrix brasiliensis 5110]|uniref:DUF2293 domain-containing protein n=1 Tax=Sporothrix brasiliensis 5110 TaxID=1398154 RepID=A0A0C2IRX5_9PEZI|nr:uncharacterized protein SPBR_05177 [Sporothrix brasiliensis 5110]KIH87752.1 hypothetical protein SPBR_05177 [Sporothrix brasiliensis 5110]
MQDNEVVVHPRTPMPHGYTFVPKGNVYVTANCRRQTHAAAKTVYVVARDKNVLGIRCPTGVVDAVRAAEKATRAARQVATAKRDAALAATFRAALLAAYPALPPGTTADEIVQHAMTKHAGRVARTSTRDEAARVRLAVRAHIRHRWTDYETMLREAGATGGRQERRKRSGRGRKRDGKLQRRRRAEARAQTVGRVNAIEREWAGRSRNGPIDSSEGSVDDEVSRSQYSEEGESDDSEEIEENEENEDEDDVDEDVQTATAKTCGRRSARRERNTSEKAPAQTSNAGMVGARVARRKLQKFEKRKAEDSHWWQSGDGHYN